MTAKYTPGPWRHAYTAAVEPWIETDDGTTLAIVEHLGAARQMETRANALLMAAAPMMYEMLKSLAHGLVHPRDGAHLTAIDRLIESVEGGKNEAD